MICEFCGKQWCKDCCRVCGAALDNEKVPLAKRTRSRMDRCPTCEDEYLTAAYPEDY